MNYTKIKQEIEQEQKDKEEQESIKSFRNILNDLDITVR